MVERQIGQRIVVRGDDELELGAVGRGDLHDVAVGGRTDLLVVGEHCWWERGGK